MYLQVIATAFLVAGMLVADTSAQTSVVGRVIDAETSEPLAGVNVIFEGSTIGTTSDDDGWFTLSFESGRTALLFSHVGYLPRSVSPVGSEELIIRLEPRFMDLQPMIVSAARYEESRTAAPVAVAALSAHELAERRANSLAEAVNVLAGVHMTDLGNEQHAMSIRQPLSYRALFAYLEDGIPLRPPGIFNHNALIEINMAAADRIEVVRGPSSSLYGSNAIGGAVNFITPRPSERTMMSVGLRTNDNGYRRADLTASGTSGRVGIRAGGYRAQQRGGWAEHSDFDKLSFSLRADYAASSTTRLITTLSTNRLTTDTNGSLDSLSFFQRDLRSRHTFTYRSVDASRLTSRVQHVWGRRHSTDVAVFWRSNRVGQLPHYRIRSNWSDPTTAWGEVNSDRFRSLGVNAQHQTYLPWMDGRFIAGFSLDRSPNSHVAHYLDVTHDIATGRFTDFVVHDSLLTDYRVHLVNQAAYVQLEISPFSRLKTVGSLRMDRVAYDYVNHLPPSAYSGAPDESNSFTRISPRVGVTYDLSRGRGLYANYSQGFLPPEVSELYRGVRVPTLRPALFHSYEAGGWASLLSGRLMADISMYRMDGTDEIISVRLDDGTMENRNAGRTRHAGIEYAIIYSPTHALNLRFTGTNARHEFVRYRPQSGSLDGNVMDAAPTWMANAEIIYRPTFMRRARLGLEWEHIGPYYMDPENTMRYSGYDLLHVRMSYALQRFDLWMNLRNLTNELYATIASKSGWGQQYVPGAPRSITLGFVYTFQDR